MASGVPIDLQVKDGASQRPLNVDDLQHRDDRPLRYAEATGEAVALPSGAVVMGWVAFGGSSVTVDGVELSIPPDGTLGHEPVPDVLLDPVIVGSTGVTVVVAYV